MQLKETDTILIHVFEGRKTKVQPGGATYA